MKAAVLGRRGVLRLAGRDTVGFLHAMSTCDANHRLGQGVDLAGSPLLYTAFLSPKGRVLFDAIVHPQASSSQPELLLEMDRSSVPAAIEHLREYKLRKKVTFTDASEEFDVHASWSSSPTSDATASDAVDPRPPLQEVGFRRGLRRRSENVSNFTNATEGDYEEALYRNGVGEGSSAFISDRSIPFDGNLDLLDGVSFRKGCYVGQELTHRTHIMLTVRKRLVPLTLAEAGRGTVPLPDGWWQGKHLKSATSPVSAGRILGWSGSRGVGLLRLGNVDPATWTASLTTSSGDGEVLKMQASIPAWWPQDVRDIVRAEADKKMGAADK